jgi:hypothetical protein
LGMRAAKFIAISAAVLVVLTAVVGVVLVGRYVATSMSMQLEGREFGRGRNLSTCVDEALVRADRCADAGAKCDLRAVAFGSGCALRAEADAICTGAPPTRNVGANIDWARSWCVEHGRARGFVCEEVVSDVRSACTVRQRRKAAP